MSSVTRVGNKVEQDNWRLPRWLEVLGVLVIACELIAPFVSQTYGPDGPSQIYWLGKFSGLVFQGEWIPRWIPDGFSGLGSPAFYFYPPLSFYLATAVRAITTIADPHAVFQATGLLATLASGFTAYALLRRLGGIRYQAIVGACIYAFAPFRVAELYSRSSLSSHVGFVFVPLLWYGLVVICDRAEQTRWKGIVFVSLSTAALVLSNIPLALLNAMTVTVGAIVRWRTLDRRIIYSLVASVLLAIGLSAFYLERVLEYSSLVQLDHLIRDPDFVLLDIIHLQNVNALYYTAGIYFAIGCLVWAFIRIRKIGRSNERELLSLGLAIAGLIVFLQLPYITLPLWRHLKLLQLIQGTWRFYIVMILFVAAALAIGRSGTLLRSTTAIVTVWSISALLPLFLILSNVHLFAHYTAGSSDAQEYAPLVAPRTAVAFEELVNVQHRNGGGFVSSVAARGVRVVNQGPREQLWQVDLPEAAPLTLNQFDWKQWKLRKDGVDIPSRTDSVGRATFELPGGHYSAQLNLETSRGESVARWISLLSVVVLLYGIRKSRVALRSTL